MNFLQREWEEIRPHIKAHVVILAGTAVVSAAGVWITRLVQSEIGISLLPLRFYVVLAVLAFCAILLSIVLLFVFARFMAKRNVPEMPTPAPMPNLEELRARLFPPPPPDPPRLPDPPKPVDLRGKILEIYIATFDDLPHISKTYVAMKVQIKNHGPDEATILSCGLHISLGTWQVDGKVMNAVPENWRIKKKRENSFLVVAYDEIPLEPRLRADAVYKKGYPLTGWLVFELYAYGDIEFPNAQFELRVVDSFDERHFITREPGVYQKTGELIRLELPAPIPV